MASFTLASLSSLTNLFWFITLETVEIDTPASAATSFMDGTLVCQEKHPREVEGIKIIPWKLFWKCCGRSIRGTGLKTIFQG